MVAGALRKYTESPVRQGRLASPWERVVGGRVLGSREFAAKALRARGADTESDSDVTWRPWAPRPEWAAIVEAAERIGGRRWSKAVEGQGSHRR